MTKSNPHERRLPLAEIHTINLGNRGERSLYDRLYFALRELILKGDWAPGIRLPSTRLLAKAQGLSRNTVLAAYEQLAAEGFIEARRGSGSFVTELAPNGFLEAQRPDRGQGSASQTGLDLAENGDEGGVLSRRGQRIWAISPRSPAGPPIPFHTGLPDLAAFPLERWTRLLSKHWRRAGAAMLAYGDPAGHSGLRAAVAEYLTACRGVRCTAAQVIIVAGAQQALDLTSRLLLDPGDAVWVEEPCYQGARGALAAADTRLYPIPLDSEGLDLEKGIRHGLEPKLIYVTPSHQYPTGVTTSLTRRLALLAYAQRCRAWIVEDDYDSEYRYAGRPFTAMQGLDENERVIYLGTFSKVCFPALRIGYLVVPPRLVEAFCTARSLVDSHQPMVTQAALAEFIREGWFAGHIRRMRNLYGQRQAVLVDALQAQCSEDLRVERDDAGMHLVARFRTQVDDRAFTRFATQKGMQVRALSSYFMEEPGERGLILGYAAFAPDELKRGAEKLAALLRAFGNLSQNA